MLVQHDLLWQRPIQMISGVSSRAAPLGRPCHDQRIRVPGGVGSKVSVPSMPACCMIVREASQAGLS